MYFRKTSVENGYGASKRNKTAAEVNNQKINEKQAAKPRQEEKEERECRLKERNAERQREDDIKRWVSDSRKYATFPSTSKSLTNENHNTNWDEESGSEIGWIRTTQRTDSVITAVNVVLTAKRRYRRDIHPASNDRNNADGNGDWGRKRQRRREINVTTESRSTIFIDLT